LPTCCAIGPLTVTEHRDDHDEDEQDQRDADLQRLELPDRAPLLDLVDRVRRAAERADVVRGGVEREQQADDEAEARGALAAGDALDGARDDLLGRPGATPSRFSSSGSVSELPTRPRIDTSAMSAGNSDSTP
jgi:hypothetical protein